MTDRDYLAEAIAREIHRTWCPGEKHSYGEDDYERALKLADRVRVLICGDAEDIRAALRAPEEGTT